MPILAVNLYWRGAYTASDFDPTLSRNLSDIQHSALVRHCRAVCLSVFPNFVAGGPVLDRHVRRLCGDLCLDFCKLGNN